MAENEAQPDTKPVRLFYSYSHKDEKQLERLLTHLALMRRQGMILEWHDRQIVAGQEWEDEIDKNLEDAQVILLLISPDFLASDYCYGKEMKRALEKHAKGESIVIPIMVQPVDWKGSPFSGLQALPKDAKPITLWRNRNAAWQDVALGIRRAISQLTRRSDEPNVVDIPNNLPIGVPSKKPHSNLSLHDEFDVQGKATDDYRLNIDFWPPSDEVLLSEPYHFVGRVEERRWLLDRLQSGTRSVSAVSGLAGIGKTSLVASIVRELAKHNAFPDGIAVIPCQNLTDQFDILSATLSHFDKYHRSIQHSDGDRLRRAVQEILHGKRCLVVLDDVQNGVDLREVIPLLYDCGISVILTSRHTLPSDIVPADSKFVLEPLAVEEAIELFTYALGKDTSAQPSNMSEQKSIEEIIVNLGQHPLAVELVGAYAGDLQLDLAALANTLHNPQKALEVSRGESPAILRQVFGDIFSTLPTSARQLLVMLSAFGELEVGRRAVLAVATRLNISDAENMLNLLILRGLLRPLVNNSMPKQSDRERLRMHTLVHAFALGEFDNLSADERDTMKVEIASYYVSYLGDGDNALLQLTKKGDVNDWMSALSADAPNIMHVLESAYREEPLHRDRKLLDTIVLSLCLNLHYYWHFRGLNDEMLRYGPIAMAAADRLAKDEVEKEEIDRIRFYTSMLVVNYADALMASGQFSEAEKVLRATLSIRQELGDKQGESAVLFHLALVASRIGDVELEDSLLKQSLAIITKLNEPDDQAVVLQALSSLQLGRSRLAEAERYLQQAETLMRHHGLSNVNSVLILVDMSKLAFSRRELDEAERYAKEAFEICNSNHLESEMARVFHELGQIERSRKNWERAVEFFEKSLEAALSLGQRRAEAIARNALGNISLELGKIDDAERYLNQSLSIFREIHSEHNIGMQLTALGFVALTRDDLDAAEIYALQGMLIAEKVQNVADLGGCLLILGTVAQERGRNSEAQSYFNKSLPHLRQARRDNEVKLVEDRLRQRSNG